MEDFKAWIVKILLPSLVAISIKIAIQSKTMRMTWFNVITSFVSGVGCAYLLADAVLSTVAPEYTSAVIATVAISGEKIGYWLVYRFNVESLLEGLLDKVRSKK